LSNESDEESKDISLDPNKRLLYLCNKPHDETSFKITWKKKNHELYSMKIAVKCTLGTDIQYFCIAPPQQGKASSVRISLIAFTEETSIEVIFVVIKL